MVTSDLFSKFFRIVRSFPFVSPSRDFSKVQHLIKSCESHVIISSTALSSLLLPLISSQKFAAHLHDKTFLCVCTLGDVSSRRPVVRIVASLYIGTIISVWGSMFQSQISLQSPSGLCLTALSESSASQGWVFQRASCCHTVKLTAWVFIYMFSLFSSLFSFADSSFPAIFSFPTPPYRHQLNHQGLRPPPPPPSSRGMNPTTLRAASAAGGMAPISHSSLSMPSTLDLLASLFQPQGRGHHRIRTGSEAIGDSDQR